MGSSLFQDSLNFRAFQGYSCTPEKVIGVCFNEIFPFLEQRKYPSGLFCRNFAFRMSYILSNFILLQSGVFLHVKQTVQLGLHVVYQKPLQLWPFPLGMHVQLIHIVNR